MSEPKRIVAVELRVDDDLVLARHRAREIAALLGFGQQDCTRIATAVSEIARNAFRYATGGRVSFALDATDFVVTITDRGPGIADLDSVLNGTYVSTTGMGMGIVGAQRLVDQLTLETTAAGTTVVLRKRLPEKTAATTLAKMTQSLGTTSSSAYEEVQWQNQELVRTLDELRIRNNEVERLNQELADTNRGVLALYAELDDKAESLRRASELKTRFLSNMSHEFRTPLNSMLSITGLLAMELDGPLLPEQRKQIDYIRTSARALADMVNDLLDIAKIEAGKTDVRMTEFRLDDFFAALRGMFRPLMTSDRVSLEIETPESLLVNTDEGKLSQIVRNFISNAIKFTSEGSVRVRGEVAGGQLTIWVSDSGIGIPATYLDSIFEEFVQVENPLQKKAKGTGLGLSLSRHLARLLGGDVAVQSEHGQGSTFSVTVPVQFREAPHVSGAEPKVSVDDDAIASTARVLIVDDDEAARYALASMLPKGCRVDQATDGPEGIVAAKSIAPDIVFLDLMMPSMNGIEVLRRLRRDPITAKVPVVIRTSKSLTGEEEETLRDEGVFDVMDKNRALEEQVIDLRSILQRAQLLEAL